MKATIPDRLRILLFADTLLLSVAERRLSAGGTLVCVALCCWLLQSLPPAGFPVLASLGASAIILFAMPHSPVAQPWPVIGGYFFAGATGFVCAALLPSPALSAAVAVALCVWLMARYNCIHPPGGALALMLAIDHSPAALPIPQMSAVIAANVVLLMICAVLINKFLLRRQYPYGAQPAEEGDLPTLERDSLNHEDLENAIRKLDIFVDIREHDLVTLYNLAVEHAFNRHSGLTCADIMSREVVCTSFSTELEVAWQQLHSHQIKAMPVLDNYRRLVGMVSQSDFLRGVDSRTASGTAEGLRALLRRTPGEYSDKPEVVGQIMCAEVHAVHPDTPVAKLIRLSFAQRTHQIPVVDERRQVVGMIGRSDMTAALYRQIALAKTGESPHQAGTDTKSLPEGTHRIA